MVIVFRNDCKVFGCISSKSEQNWCFELVDGYLAFELVLRVVLYYIILYIIIHILLLYINIHILLLLYIILYLILYSSFSPLSFFLPIPNLSFLFRSSILPHLPNHSILVGTYICILYILSSSSSIPLSPSLLLQSILYLSVLTYTYLYPSSIFSNKLSISRLREYIYL